MMTTENTNLYSLRTAESWSRFPSAQSQPDRLRPTSEQWERRGALLRQLASSGGVNCAFAMSVARDRNRERLTADLSYFACCSIRRASCMRSITSFDPSTDRCPLSR